MIKNAGRGSRYLSAILMMACLFCCASFTVYAGELPASHPSCITCKGQLSPLGRWCDNGNGTVTDMTTGLVWLKDAGWGGQYPLWIDKADGVDAISRVAQVKDGNPATLSDGSLEGDWTMPTLKQLNIIATGTEAISYFDRYFFTHVLGAYWSVTTYTDIPNSYAWWVSLVDGGHGYTLATNSKSVWPVRDGR
ncbi:MAG: DUF1566 domain-containing protein [Deltaproteobacteria bacterium]|nr:DUF1566 domain-containing protein [Deltaproteobacteria bacterium]